MKDSQIVVRKSLELGKSKLPQIFNDVTGRRWRFAKILLSFGLIFIIVFGFFGIESTFRSMKSYLSLEAGTETSMNDKYPVVVKLGAGDYAHFKEYVNNFSEVLLEGRVTTSEDNLLEFKQKYIVDVPQLYVENVNPEIVALLGDEEGLKAYMSTLQKYLERFNYSGIALKLTEDFDVNTLLSLKSAYEGGLSKNLSFRWMLQNNSEIDLKVVTDSKPYQLVTIDDLLDNPDHNFEGVIPIFNFEYRLGSTLIPVVNYQEKLEENAQCSYDVIGDCGDYQVLDSLAIQRALDRGGYNGDFGYAGLSEVDSRAWNLKNYSFNEGPEEIFLTTSIIRQGEGEMYHLLQKPKPLKVELVENESLYNTTVVELPQQARVVRFGKKIGHINLSFDDGPHPEYTPAILDILKEKNVTATFHVVGDNVRKHPDIVKRIVDEGHETGNHTYLHPRTYYLRSDAFRKEVELTQDAIREVSGVEPVYFRTPFNDTDGYATNYDLKNLEVLQDLGLQVAEFEVDSRDWTKPGVEQIRANVLDKIDSGDYSQVLFHDGGGDKSQTIQALPSIIDDIQDRGIAFAPLTELNHHHEFETQSQGRLWNIRNRIKAWNSKYLSKAFWGYATVFAWIMFVKLFLTLFLFGLALLKKRKITDHQPGVSVIVPAYNEEKTILDTVKSVLASDYPLLEVIVVDDGSKDNTLKKLSSKYSNNPKVQILAKENGGKSSASNYGLLQAKYDFVVCIDADTIMLENTISKLMRNFIDEKVGGVSGNIHVGNYDSFLTQTQRAEYIYGQSFDKEIFSLTNAIPVVPGALGAWRKEDMIAVGGYSNQTLAEDTDLTLRIRKLGRKIVYEKDAIAITEAPSNIRDFVKQRIRWQYGTLQCLWKHKSMVFNPRYGYLGIVVLPETLLSYVFLGMMVAYLYMLVILLFNFTISLFSSRADIQMLIGGDFTRSLMFVMGSLALYYISNVMAVLVDNNKNKWQVLWYLPYQMIVYRAILWFTQCLVVLKAIRGGHQSWNHLQRKGLSSKAHL